MPNTVEMGKVQAIDCGNRGIGIEHLCDREMRLHSCVEEIARKRGEMCIWNCGVTISCQVGSATRRQVVVALEKVHMIVTVMIVYGTGELVRVRKLDLQDSTVIVNTKFLSLLVHLLELCPTLWVALCLMSFLRRYCNGPEMNYAHN